MVSNDSFVVVDDGEDHEDAARSVPGFTRTYWLTETRVDDHGLRIADGLVRLRTVYVEHPVRGGFLVPLAGYHRFVFEDKAVQAMELAATLGARRIEAEHVTGYGLELRSGHGAREVGDGRFVLGAEYRRAFTPPAADAFDGWAVEIMQRYPWMAYERTWQAMVQGRSDATLSSIVLPVTLESDGGIDADAIEAVEAAGLSAGGSWVPFERTAWRLHIAFRE